MQRILFFRILITSWMFVFWFWISHIGWRQEQNWMFDIQFMYNGAPSIWISMRMTGPYAYDGSYRYIKLINWYGLNQGKGKPVEYYIKLEKLWLWWKIVSFECNTNVQVMNIKEKINSRTYFFWGYRNIVYLNTGMIFL